MSGWRDEVAAGQRFGFGANWREFLSRLDEGRMAAAEDSVAALLGRRDLTGLRLLDMGSGSGLFSLAARRLGAEVTSCDYDPDSVACAEGLRERFRPGDPGWTICRGSVLDGDFLAGLGHFDVVYCWGVLHHTGDQWAALDGLCRRVAPGGQLAVALYNHQPFFTPLHTAMKRVACRGSRARLLAISLVYALGVGAALALADLLRGRDPLKRHAAGGLPRGMSFWHDVVDWVGGWPFETSTPEQVFEFCRARGLGLRALRTVGGKSGCNEFVFERPAGEGACASS